MSFADLSEPSAISCFRSEMMMSVALWASWLAFVWLKLLSESLRLARARAK